MKSIKLQKMQEAGNTLSFSIELLAEPISIFTFNSFDVLHKDILSNFLIRAKLRENATESG
jgi:hypothetical protein